MTDLYLHEGTTVTISSDSSYDRVYFTGGKIKIIPTVSFVFDEFVFKPTTSDDALGKIFNTFKTRAELETGRGGLLNGFMFYDMIPDTISLHFPCMVFDRYQLPSDISAEFFGGEFMYGQYMLIDLAFKENKYMDIDGERLGKKELADNFLFNMREKFNDIKYESEVIRIGAVEISGSVQEPMEKNQTLYGFTMDVFVEYKTE